MTHMDGLDDRVLELLALEFRDRVRPLVGRPEAPVDVALELMVRVDAAARRGLVPDAYVVKKSVRIDEATVNGTNVVVNGVAHPIVAGRGGRRRVRWWRGSPRCPSEESTKRIDAAIDGVINAEGVAPVRRTTVINLNDVIEATLTVEGMAVAVDAGVASTVGRDASEVVVRMQLWEFCRVFGPRFMLGRAPVVSNTVVVESEDE